MPNPPQAELKEAMFWLFVGTLDNHIFTCASSKFPDENPTCMEQCCPTCCGPCSALRWLSDHHNDYLTKLLNRFHLGEKHDWQFADGSVDWSQIDRHWDDSGVDCHNRHDLAGLAEQLRDRRGR
jgi:hypothetical protein